MTGSAPLTLDSKATFVRILVLGTSSSGGTGLEDRHNAWPWLVRDHLAETTGQPVEVEHVIVFPVGPKAVPLAIAAVERVQPDLLIYSFGAYPCAVATVGTRVRRRYGERAYSYFRKAELRFERWTANRDGHNAPINRWGRKLVRRVIGADPMTTYDEVCAVETELLHTLSQREGLEVIVFGEPSMGAAIARDNPGANPMLARLRHDIEAVARSHHYPIAECTTAFDTHPHRDHLFHSDGVHKTILGHQLQAAAVVTTLAT